MSYRVRFSFFLLAGMKVTGGLGNFSAHFGPWVCVLVILVMIPLTIEVGRKLLERYRL